MNRQPCLFVLIAVTASVATFFPNPLKAASTDEGRITQVKNQVQLVTSNQVARRAAVNAVVHEQTVVRTGAGSHGEVAFPDQTIVRLAARSEFDFNHGTRGLNLESGAALVQAPKGAKGATIHAGTVAASVADTTAMIEYHRGFYKFLVLEGTARLYRPGHLGDSVLVSPGQMVFGDPESALSDPVDIDIARFIKTSHLITDFSLLPSVKSIAAESQKQQHEQTAKNLVATNLVILGGGTQVSITDQGQPGTADRKTAALATPHRAQNMSPNAAPNLP